MDRSSSISESVASPTSTTNFYGGGSDDDSDEGEKTDQAKDAAAVSDGMADPSIGDSEYEMHEDHRLLISKALQLLRVNYMSGNNGACRVVPKHLVVLFTRMC